MSTPITVTKLDSKSHSTPDELRTPDKTRVEIVKIAGVTIGRYTFAPGWRWSECVKPVVHTESCQVSHVGYAVSGRLHLTLTDGTKRDIVAGESYSIPPGHDSYTDEGFVGIEIMGAEQFAKG